MELTYQLSAADFLEYQMYQSSKSEQLKRRRIISRVLLSLLYIGMGAYFKILRDQTSTAAIFAGAGVLWYVFYPAFAKWRYKNHFKRHIALNYQDRIGRDAVFSIAADGIDLDDGSGSGHVKAEALAHLIELKEHVLVVIDNGVSLIIPKHAIDDVEKFQGMMLDFNMKYHDHKEWKWS